MKAGRVFAISMVLNLALAGWAAWWLGRPRGNAVSEERNPVPAARAPLAPEPPLTTSNATVAVTYLTNRFHWSRIETNDFVSLANNLRAIGCPEKTVRELVSARAIRALERLARDTAPKLPFWTAGLRRERAKRAAEPEAFAARDKILASVEQVLGRGNFLEDPKLKEDFVGQAIFRFISGPMSEETFDRLQIVFSRQEAEQDQIRARAHGVLLESDERALMQLNQQLRAELATILSPVELEEFTARFGIMESVDRVDFEAAELTQSEVRQIGLLRGRFGLMGLKHSGFGTADLSDEQEARLTLDLKQLLGEARYAQFVRAGDHEFKTLFELGRDNQLPRDVAVRAYELRQLTVQEVAALRADAALSAPERQQRLAAMQAETQAALLKVLGATACQQYLQRGGAWVTNLSRL